MSIYPNWTAGKRLTADSLAAGQLLIAYKPSSTDRASTTTLTNDPDLQLTLAANATYWVEWFLHYAGPTNGAPPTTTGTIAVQWSVPSGATGQRGIRGPATNANNSNQDNVSMTAGVFTFATAVQYGARASSNTNQSLAREEGIVTTTSAGICAISWAQAVSSTTANRMANGSWGRALRIA